MYTQGSIILLLPPQASGWGGGEINKLRIENLRLIRKRKERKINGKKKRVKGEKRKKIKEKR